MMMQVDAATLRRLWPRAPAGRVEAVAARSAAVFAKHGITSDLRVAHFMAQISHESGGGTITEESLDYTHAERIAAVWPTRFTTASAAPYVRDPRKLADAVYNGRMGNRPGSTDGYDYRGRGPLQLTGRDSYRDIGARCGLPLEQRPELAAAPTTGLEIAATEFEHLGCLPFCDADNVEAVTRRVNGGYTGLADRKAWLAKWKNIPFDATAAGDGEVDRAPVARDMAPLGEGTSPVPPATPSLPRGSDEVLPPGVDTPGKTMAGSKTGWAAILAMITGMGTTLGQAMEAVKPLLADPRMVALILAVSLAAGAFIWFDRRKRLQADHA